MAIRTRLPSLRDHYAYWVLLAFVGLTFLTGGGARNDIQSLVILRPAAAISLGVGLWAMTREEVSQFRWLIRFAGLCVLLVGLHLIPLPPGVWTLLPGREIIEQSGQVAGIRQPWRPLSMVPITTWNSFFALLVPLAVLLLAVRCTREQRFSLLPVLIIFGLVSGFIGLLQAIGPAHGPLYFYRITNNGFAVGLLSNRNHNALLLACLFPMFAVYACTGVKSVEQARLRGWVAIGAGVVLVPLILVAGSRAGLILGVFGLASVPLLYRNAQISKPAKRKVRRVSPRIVVGTVAILGLGAMTVLLSRARSFERLVSTDKVEDIRWAVWEPILHMTGRYFPFGTGIGTFVEVYQVDEPHRLLSPNYLNHAHNDWLEILLTGGLPAIILAVVAGVAWAWVSWRLFHVDGDERDIAFGRLGAVLVFIVAAASLVDYPLRVPSLATLFTIAAVWMAAAARAFANPAAHLPKQGRREPFSSASDRTL